jgi:two-component system sensor histidine kinase KdpD
VAAAVIVRERDGALTALAAAGDRGALPDLTLDTVHRVVNVVINDGLGVAWTLDRRHWDKALELPSAGLSWLPLINESRVLGVLCLARPGAGPPDEPVRRVVESLANHAGVVLARENLARLEAETRALAEVDRLKTALLSMVSHDFRSPLAAIKASATGLMQDGEPLDSPTVREMLAGINSEVDRLNRMVENILALSRLEAGAWQPRVEPTPVAEVVGAALEGLSKADNARVAVRLAPDLDLVACDPVQMAQVLHNLIENALKYTSGEIEVAAEADESAVRLSVADRGPGLPPELSGEMFEPFVRARHLRESAVPGVGLGLTICRGLVEAHGGTLSALPRHGGGTVFEVRLPHATGDRS